MKDDLEIAKEAIGSEDYVKALRIVRPLAEAENAKAQGYLGFMYQLGLGVNRNGLEAIKWLQKAADQGDGSAAHNLGTIYLGGMPGIPVDQDLAKKWYRKARDLGFVTANSEWYE
ncbi:MAG: sel1 repeat family protein [Chlamydiae bacterium]|nr:sel1 repeat family protein [Chlamydiota bacterium]MBI3276138.1 sel1 repeat family protein [Chlamydiota bacterium]